MLTIGATVRVRWSGKTGRVLNPRLARHRGNEGPPGVLVILAPFVPAWAGGPVPSEAGRTLAGLEVIYAPEDLEVVERP